MADGRKGWSIASRQGGAACTAVLARAGLPHGWSAAAIHRHLLAAHASDGSHVLTAPDKGPGG
jgi:hypothetical protein